MVKNIYKWNGKKVKVVFGYCKVKENEKKPMTWYNFECCNVLERNYGTALIPAIKINSNGKEFVIANHYGIGVNKLLKGGMWNQKHFSLPLETFEGNLCKTEVFLFCIRHFDEKSYSEHESQRVLWQRKNYPVEFEQLENFKEIMNNQKLCPACGKILSYKGNYFCENKRCRYVDI